MGDGRHCPHCKTRVLYRPVLDCRQPDGQRLIAVENEPALKGRIGGGPTNPGDPIVVLLRRDGTVFRGWVDPAGDIDVRRVHASLCAEWKPPKRAQRPKPGNTRKRRGKRAPRAIR